MGDTKNRVLGIGGVFFKTQNKKELHDWYKKHLGFNKIEDWGTAFEQQVKESSEKTNYTVWGTFPSDTEYFNPSNKSYMINYIVEDLQWLSEQLKKEGVDISEIEEHEEGLFAWLIDPEGTKLELWEPK